MSLRHGRCHTPEQADDHDADGRDPGRAWWERLRRWYCRLWAGHDYVEGTCRRCEDTLW